jgi:hypothetical protein
MGAGLHGINGINLYHLQAYDLKYNNDEYPKIRKLSKKDPETITLTSAENNRCGYFHLTK